MLLIPGGTNHFISAVEQQISTVAKGAFHEKIRWYGTFKQPFDT